MIPPWDEYYDLVLERGDLRTAICFTELILDKKGADWEHHANCLVRYRARYAAIKAKITLMEHKYPQLGERGLK